MVGFLSQLRGHHPQRAALARMLTADRAVHALILDGPVGVGKTTIAEALAASLTCLDLQANGDACGVCRSCHALSRGDHIDVQRIERSGQGIRIDAIREATRSLRYEPVLGRTKVVMLLDAERLREEAGNALLKTLEEPASATVFLLVTSRPQLLLDTIRSRCQNLRFGPLGEEDIRAILLEEGLEPSLVPLAAALADGSLSAARLRADERWRPVVELVADFTLGLGAHKLGAEVAFVEALTARLDGMTPPAAPDETLDASAIPTATLAEAKSTAPSDAGVAGKAHVPPQRASKKQAKVGGSAPSRGKPKLERDALAWAIELLRALLRDALLVSVGIDAATLPHSPWADGLRDLAARAGADVLAAAIDSCDRVEAGLVLNPGTTLALEALLVEIGGAVRVVGNS
mgnify:CR=1 FL=1